jgi:hypothetical protein
MSAQLKFLLKMFKNKQVEFDQLNTYLDVASLKTKFAASEDSWKPFIKSEFEISAKLNFGITSESIHSWYARIQYQKKLADYKRLHNKWRDDLSFLGVSAESLPFFSNSFSPRLASIKRLIDCLEILSENYESSLEFEFLKLEIEFLASLSKEDKIVLYASGVVKPANTSLLHLYKKYFKSRLSRLVRSMQARTNRDLRDLLRKIIRFHFNNLNDETDAEHLFLNRSLRKDLFKSKIIIHANNKYSRPIAAYT